MDLGTASVISVGIITVGAGVASSVKSICGSKTCDMHNGVAERLKVGDHNFNNLFAGITTLKEGIARIEGKIEMLIIREKEK